MAAVIQLDFDCFKKMAVYRLSRSLPAFWHSSGFSAMMTIIVGTISIAMRNRWRVSGDVDMPNLLPLLEQYDDERPVNGGRLWLALLFRVPSRQERPRFSIPMTQAYDDKK